MSFQNVILLLLGIISGIWSKSVRIYGGRDSDIRNYPYVVSIRQYVSNGLICCGTIIGRRHVLTSAHCLNIHPSYFPLIKVYAGTSSVLTKEGQAFKILKTENHPEFVNIMQDEEIYRYDIAVITIIGVFQFDEFTNKIKLPTGTFRPGEVSIIAGWGKALDRGPIVNDILQIAYTTVLDKQSCIAAHPFHISFDQMCVYQRPGVGICVGDSGGPLVSNGVVVGIASFGIPCALGVPDIYTNVYSCIDFIRSIVPYERV